MQRRVYHDSYGLACNVADQFCEQRIGSLSLSLSLFLSVKYEITTDRRLTRSLPCVIPDRGHNNAEIKTDYSHTRRAILFAASVVCTTRGVVIRNEHVRRKLCIAGVRLAFAQVQWKFFTVA